jgi:hypothetical protein
MINASQINKFYLKAQNQFLRFFGNVAQIFYRNSLYAILLGLPGLALSIERILRYLNQDNIAVTKSLYFSWARNYLFPEQRYQIIGYLIAALVGYFIFLVSLRKASNDQGQKGLIKISVAASLMLDLAPKSNSISFNAFALMIWGFLLIMNIERKLFNTKIFYLSIKSTLGSRAFYIALTWGVFFTFVYANYSITQKQFILYNDNIDLIPNTASTKPSTKEANSVTNLLFQAHQKIRCSKSYNLGKIDVYPGLQPRLQGTKFYLNKGTSELCFYGRLKYQDFRVIKDFSPNFSEDKFRDTLEQNIKHEDQISLRVNDFTVHYSFEVNKTYEQFENIFHHHFQVLGPINEYRILQEAKNVGSLYGLVYIPIGFILNNVMKPSYEDFITLFFYMNILYLLIFILLISRIFQAPKYVLISALLMTSSIYSLGYITYFTGLGYGSFRHFFDVIVLYTFFKYLKKEQNLYLILTFIFCYLALFLNLEFGFFALAALNATLLIKIVAKNSNLKEKLCLFFGDIISIVVVHLIRSNSKTNAYEGGFLAGMWGFPIEGWRIYIWIATFTILFAYSLRKSKFDRSSVSIYLPLYLLFYSSLLYVYWMLIPNYGHFYMALPFFIVMFLSYLYFDGQLQIFHKIKLHLVDIFLILATALFIQSITTFISSKNVVDSLNDKGIIYNWNFENARFKSTINPKYFEEAINLIHKYSSPNSGIYIISPFDNILYWLSKTYSKMPSSDMLSYLGREEDLKVTKNLLNRNLPNYIFVGSCVDCINTFELIDFDKYKVSQLHVKDRMERLNNLESVYIDLMENYRLVESGALISVYQKRE